MELTFDDLDFEGLMIPVLNLPDNADPLEAFVKLKTNPVFSALKFSKIKLNKIVRYIVLTYDMKSPFRAKVGDPTTRKVEVALFVRLITSPKNIPDDIKKILLNQNDSINKAIIEYIRMHRNSKYALVTALENIFYNDLLKVQQGLKPSRDINQTQKELEEATVELLNQDNNPQLIKDLFDQIEIERVQSFRPEGIADALMGGKDPFEGEEYDYVTD